MSKNALQAAGCTLEVKRNTNRSMYWNSSAPGYYALKLNAHNLVIAEDGSPKSLELLSALKSEVYDLAFQECWKPWIQDAYELRWSLGAYNYNKTFHDGVMESAEDDRTKMFALLCHKHMNDSEAALEVAREHVKTHASRPPKTRKELMMYLHPALAQYGAEYFDLMKSLVQNTSSLEALKSKAARDFQLSLFNMTYGYKPKVHKDILVKDWEIIELDEESLKDSRSFSYRYSGVPFQVKVFRDYTQNLRVADLLETPNVIPKNTAGRAAIKIMEDYLSGDARTPADRLNLTVSAFQALVSRYSTDEELAKRGFYGEIFSEVFMPMRDSENLMRLTKTYFESEESVTAQYKTWNSVLHILLGLDKNKWAKNVSTADSIASLMMKEMSEMEVIRVLRSLVGEDPAIPPMTPTQWIKYLEVYKDYKDSPPSIIVSLIR